MVEQKYFDDFSVGDRFVTGGVTLTESDIIDFALRYDPQPFHLDANAASESAFGGLIASGYQSLALCFRLFIQTGILTEASMGSPGIDELRWLSPVRPGDTLHTVVDVKEVIPSKSKPDRGIVRFRYAAINQHDEEALSFVLNHFLRRRPA
ncbi:MAG: MaoC family dehydratase [Rhodothermales bacterium]